MLTIHIILHEQTILKSLGLFDNLAFVIMSTRENICLIARASFGNFRIIFIFKHVNMVIHICSYSFQIILVDK